MPYINVHIDKGELLDSLSDEELVEELEDRNAKHRFGKDYSIPIGQAMDSLDRASEVLRKISRLDLAHRLDEIKIDYVR